MADADSPKTLFHSQLVARALRQGIQTADAEDAVQDVWLEIYRKTIPGEVAGDPSRLLAWLSGILKNSVRDRLRHQRRSRIVPLAECDSCGMNLEADDPEPDAWVLQHELIATVRATVDRLASARSRESARCLELRYLEGLTIADVAAVMGMSVPEVNARLQRAKQRFRTKFQQ